MCNHVAEIRRHAIGTISGFSVLVFFGTRCANEQTQVIRPLLDLSKVLTRQTHHVQNDIGWQQHRDFLHEIHLTRWVHGFQQLLHCLSDGHFARLNQLEREHHIHHLSQPRVFRRRLEHQPLIEVTHHPRKNIAPLVFQGLVKRPQAIRRHVGRHGHLPDIVVTRDDPALDRRTPVHRIPLLQGLIKRERIGSDRIVGWIIDKRFIHKSSTRQGVKEREQQGVKASFFSCSSGNMN